MGCWHIYCVICGNSCYEPDIADNKNNNYKWLNKNTVLLENNKVIHNCEEINCNIMFQNKNTKEKYDASLDLDIFNYFYKLISNKCIFIHTDCWKFIKKEYNIELKYKDLPVSQMFYDIDENIGDIDYKPISNYWDQYFNYDKLIKDNNLYMLLSPLKNNSVLEKKNILRIKKIIKQLKLKNEPSRKSPSVSATFYENGSIKMGNNNNFWVKEKGKWVPNKEKIETIKILIPNTLSIKQKNIFNTIPQLGKYNNELIFVKSFEVQKKGTLFEFICSELMFNKYLKKFY